MAFICLAVGLSVYQLQDQLYCVPWLTVLNICSTSVSIPPPVPSVRNRVNITQTPREHGGGTVHASGGREDSAGAHQG